MQAGPLCTISISKPALSTLERPQATAKLMLLSLRPHNGSHTSSRARCHR